MILSCQSICKSFGEKVILQDASFHIEEREKAALIGNNGASSYYHGGDFRGFRSGGHCQG